MVAKDPRTAPDSDERHEMAPLQTEFAVMRQTETVDDSSNEEKRWRWLRPTGATVAAVSFAAIALLYVMLKLAEPQLPMGTDLYALNRPSALTFANEQGQIVGHRGAVVGERLKLTDLPPYLPAAFLAMEDRRFYQHGGVDPRGLVRAALIDFKALRVVQGGSTITQQLVKTLFLTSDRTLTRKLGSGRSLEVGATALEGIRFRAVPQPDLSRRRRSVASTERRDSILENPRAT